MFQGAVPARCFICYCSKSSTFLSVTESEEHFLLLFTTEPSSTIEPTQISSPPSGKPSMIPLSMVPNMLLSSPPSETPSSSQPKADVTTLESPPVETSQSQRCKGGNGVQVILVSLLLAIELAL